MELEPWHPPAVVYTRSVLSLGILGSGSGSNMQAILDAIAAGGLSARVALVLSDNPSAQILARAQANGIPAGVIDCSPHRMKFPEETQRETARRLIAAGVDLVCLAGFMRLVKKPLLDAFPARILNIHPSLLPAFPGLEAWKQAIAVGAEESGATVHLVDSGMDTGPILAQARVGVLPGDTPESLHARIQAAEHRLYPETIANYASQLNL
ncbi:phosphoribosylglycinamide formyltransferase [Akkermansiaceae bacterium]|nr:phosphoribosylglycinamide formyltransferase [Akkermansiaceae bacterium]